ncbi:MAG: universal stress protein [Pseudomonadota bacterium]
MAVRNILVAFNDTVSSEMALKAALIFQEQFDTHVTGLSTTPAAGLSAQVKGWLPDGVFTALQQAEAKRQDDVVDKWSKLSAGAKGHDKVHWLQLSGDATANVIEQGRYFDLIFVGQYDRSASDPHQVLHPDRIALQSGKPVVHIPVAFDPGPVNDHLVVAWDGKRAAARALSDALNLLGPAQEITVLTVEEEGSAAPSGVDTLLCHLERHDIQARHLPVKTKRRSHYNIAEAIMTVCAEQRPDVLVMGAYEHSKFREDTFGGVTETILKEAAFPVWMAH